MNEKLKYVFEVYMDGYIGCGWTLTEARKDAIRLYAYTHDISIYTNTMDSLSDTRYRELREALDSLSNAISVCGLEFKKVDSKLNALEFELEEALLSELRLYMFDDYETFNDYITIESDVLANESRHNNMHLYITFADDVSIEITNGLIESDWERLAQAIKNNDFEAVKEMAEE